MDIVLITPPGPTSRTGNRVAAARWARILRRLGHRVAVATEYRNQPADMMVAIHAWRSADAVARFKECHPGRPAVVQLSGTDIYQYIAEDPEPTLRTMRLADRLIAINALAWRKVPNPLRHKVRLVYQSATKPARPSRPDRRAVMISVIGHLRDVKDPLRTAEAVRLLPAESRVRVVQIGHAYTPEWATRARAEMERNPRYTWRGDVARAAVQRLLQRSHATVLSSIDEGGAHVISESVAAGVPVLASRMDGNVGLLGADYPGYFRVGDTKALARLIRRIETDPGFVATLRRAIAARVPLFAPAREFAAWKKLLAELKPRSGSVRPHRRGAKSGR